MTVGTKGFRRFVAAGGVTALVLVGMGSPASSVTSSLTVSKAFQDASIPRDGTKTKLTFTIQNSDADHERTGVVLVDNLPSGLKVAIPNGATNLCGGTLDAPEGMGTITLHSVTIPASGSCQFAVDVMGVTTGVWTNTSEPIDSNEDPPGDTAEATLTVVGPPAIYKTFGADFIPTGGTTSLSFTISNPNQTTALSGVTAGDLLPSGLEVANPNEATNSCGGTLEAPVGSTSGTISLTGVSLPANSFCNFSVNVTATQSGLKHNTAGAQATESGSSFSEGTDDITVADPPSISKVFGATSVPLNGTTSLTFTITNPNSGTGLSGVGFTDNLPAGLEVANPNGLNGSCGAGTITATAGSSSVGLSGATLGASGTCSFAVDVTGKTLGVKNNTSGAVTSTEGGTGNTAFDSLFVGDKPTITKAFGADSIPLNGTTTLSFTLTNPNSSDSLTGVGFTDGLPSGLEVANPNGLSEPCGGGTITAVAGSGNISLSGATLPAGGSCTFAVDVKGTTAGVKSNTSGAVTSTETGPAGTASDSLTVVAPPSISKAFGAGSIPLNGSTSLTFTITNPAANTVALTGVGFSDTLPAGLVVADTPNVSNTCGGTATAGAGTGSASLSGGSVATNSSCTLSLDVKGTTAGPKNNTSGNVTSTNGGAGNTASASVAVVAPPSISKAFAPSPIQVGGSTSLTFTIANPAANTVALTGVGFSDTLPAGLVVANTPNVSNTCGGTPTATAGTGSVSLSGASIATNSSCTLAVNVTGSTAGLKNNTSGNVSSTNGGNGNTASASITVGYNVLGFFSPLPKSSYNAGATIPVKFALGDAGGTRISDAEAQAIASSCRAQVRLDSGAPGCASYNAATDTFQFNLNTAKNLSKGTHTIAVNVFVGPNLVSTKSTTTTIK
jgi:hypothetical protein